DYRRQILSGKATFADLAKKYSQDPGSSAQGGELGWVTRGTLVKEFEDQIFDHLKKGQISEPFKTQFGYHLVQLEDYEHSYTSTFDQVRSKVLDQYKSDKAQDEVTALARQLAIKLKNKESLAKAAGELSLKSSVTPWFTGSGGIPGIAHSSAVTPDLAELYVGDWKGPLPIGGSRYYFQITQAKERPLSGKALEKASAEAVRRLGEHKQDLWVRSFLDDQRKKLKVKTYLN
ncbi:MAG TPA: peptidylprolyl isomerase, partial [bacterium]|nr:peptidylprolyl isomerase [bacterium]